MGSDEKVRDNRKYQVDDSADHPHPRDDVPVGGFYAVEEEVYQRSDGEKCPEHPHTAPSSVAACSDLSVAEVDDRFLEDAYAMAQKIALAMNIARELAYGNGGEMVTSDGMCVICWAESGNHEDYCLLGQWLKHATPPLNTSSERTT